MGRRHRTLSAAFIFLFCFSCLGEEAENIEFEFKVFGVGRDHYENLHYYSGEKFESLEFHPTHRSIRTYRYRGPATFGVYVKNPAYVETEPESQPYIKVSESTKISTAKRQLIIFAASHLNRDSTDTERTFRLFHIDDNPEVFARNTIIVVNATAAELLGRVAETKLRLPPGHSSPIPYNLENIDDAITNIAFALETKNGAKLVMSNNLKIPNNRRVLLVLEPPRRPGSMRIAVRMLSESIFPEEEKTNSN